jgi:hypothetical protein
VAEEEQLLYYGGGCEWAARGARIDSRKPGIAICAIDIEGEARYAPEEASVNRDLGRKPFGYFTSHGTDHWVLLPQPRSFLHGQSSLGHLPSSGLCP